VDELQRPPRAAAWMGTICQPAQEFHAPMRCTQLIRLATNTPKSNARVPNHRAWIIIATHIAMSLIMASKAMESP
jgi:hypothetical protein